MRAQREQWKYQEGAKVWVGTYQNSHNMPHWHYDCELLFVEQGMLDVTCGHDVYTVEAGQAFFVDSEQVHHMHARTPDTILRMVVFDYDVIRHFADQQSLAVPLLKNDFQLEEFITLLFCELTERPPFYRARTEMLVAGKLIEIFRETGTVPKKRGGSRTPDAFKRLLDEIDEKFEFYDLTSAAAFMNMNPTYFSNLFHKLTGMTFSQYLNYVKTRNVVELLQSKHDLSMTEISNRCGFTTIRNFNRIFKEFTGYTPKSLPKDYVMQESFPARNEHSANPTLAECVLLSSSDDIRLAE